MAESYLRSVTSLKHRRDYEDRLPYSQWFYAVGRLAFTEFCWMRSSWVIRASGYQSPIRNSPGFYPSILRHSGIWGAADEAVLNSVSKKKKMSRKYLYSVSVIQILYFIFSFLCFFFRVRHLLYTLRRDEIRYEQVLLFMQKCSEFTTAASYTIRTDSLTWNTAREEYQLLLLSYDIGPARHPA